VIEDNQVKMEGDFEHLKSQGLDFDAMLKTYEKKEEEDKAEDEIVFEEDEEEEDEKLTIKLKSGKNLLFES